MYNTFSDTGSYAQFYLAKESSTFRLHNNLNFQQGAALGLPYGTAYRALVTKCGARAGETVLIHGASGAVRIGELLSGDIAFRVQWNSGIKTTHGQGQSDLNPVVDLILKNNSSSVIFWWNNKF